MALLPISIRYRFHPVGQGLFASGLLLCNVEKGSEFRWVYDCGTSSGENLLEDAINDLFSDMNANTLKPRLDMVVISHFDTDHISGLVALLAKFRIRTLLLPYLTLSQRIALVFENDAIDSGYLQFYLNPVSFLAQREGIDQIVFVTGSDDEVRPNVNDEQNISPDGGRDWFLNFEKDEEQSGETGADLADFRDSELDHQIHVVFLKKGTGLSIPGIWEFVPYNDVKSVAPLSPGFRERVESLRKALIKASSDPSRYGTLLELKKCYDREFGTSSQQRNIISLFLYGGPIGRYMFQYAPIAGRFNVKIRSMCFTYNRRNLSNNCYKLSILYTGDGYLNNPSLLSQMTKYFSDYRIKQICCFQVMHHGSSNNWHLGLAAQIDPCYSIFSSDPGHKKLKHPSAEVVRDFWQHNPICVDRTSGVIYFAELGYEMQNSKATST